MSIQTVSSLTASHRGMRARITHAAGATREGTLMFAANPSYQRRSVHHWWLLAPSASALFDEDAISLQWSGADTVEFIEESA